ncbi:Hypothetical protein, putative [Bodo saltans]|uniref:Uncharacterized protein n=1 Tax=Bodo saltans TaxID=75058 RepID=A0A0S4IY71_BODSA|nr:Hypothetical protein, putative [Bodo saltans]|eukprot:CUG17000.1 Hypothetical protein, putative [Bodo saltans]
MGTWYANEYSRLLQRPHADNRPGTAPPTNTAAPMAAHHAVALQNSKNAANPWAFQAATCTIASSVRQTLGHSQADVVNHNRSADYHRVNVLETYVDEHYHNHRDHTHPLLSQHPHSSVAAAAHHGEQQMAVIQHSRPASHTSQSDGYYHHGSGEGGAYTPAQAFADRSWLRGSSFDTAKKLKPPPAGFVS